MSGPHQSVEYYLEQLKGPNPFHAYHSIIEADNAVIPLLIEAFRSESDPAIRERLVEIIWQKRVPSTLAFLGEALSDPDPRVWKQALDGLVTLASTEARKVLADAIDSQTATGPDRTEFREWVVEAIGQIDHGDHASNS